MKNLNESTALFTPDWDVIPVKDSTKDLGILVDARGDFKAQRAAVVSKVKAKAAWVLCTFKSRDISTLRTLWKSLVRPHQDYANQLWAPAGVPSQLKAQEAPLRAFTKRMGGLRHMHYWDRLAITGMSSTEHRVDRYRAL